MHVRVMSDLHLEFDNYFEIPAMRDDEHTTLVLAGDIAPYGQKLENFIADACARFKYVVFVTGNHEYYGHVIDEVDIQLKGWENDYHNFYFLQNGGIAMLDNVIFVGATLWTDCDDPELCRYVNDYNHIKGFPNTWLKPGDTARINAEHRKSLWNAFNLPACDDYPVVVVTHHPPTYKAMHPKYAGNKLNPLFYNDGLEAHIEKADVWIWGHTHAAAHFDYNGTVMLSNPKGYRKEVEEFDPYLTIKV